MINLKYNIACLIGSYSQFNKLLNSLQCRVSLWCDQALRLTTDSELVLYVDL